MNGQLLGAMHQGRKAWSTSAFLDLFFSAVQIQAGNRSAGMIPDIESYIIVRFQAMTILNSSLPVRR